MTNEVFEILWHQEFAKNDKFKLYKLAFATLTNNYGFATELIDLIYVEDHPAHSLMMLRKKLLSFDSYTKRLKEFKEFEIIFKINI